MPFERANSASSGSSSRLALTIDGHRIEATEGQTILEAADQGGVYIPRLCWMKGLSPFGACRVCLVRANGRPQPACTQPAADGMVVENDTAELREIRRNLIDMLFVEGNHFCMFCEKSGACELQALAYRFGITAPRYPFLYPRKEVDATHRDVLLDRNRCILCARCVRASHEVDGKGAFGFHGRSLQKRLIASSSRGLRGSNLTLQDAAVHACPTGSLLVKRTGFAIPVGLRPYDRQRIGADVETAEPEQKEEP